MGGGGKGGGNNTGASPEVTQGELQNQSALVSIAQQQSQNAQQLFGLTEPGLATAEDFYTKLASGDPSSIMQAIGPAAGQIQQSAQGATKSILETAPAGGEKNLALAEVQANKGAQVGNVATSAFLGAPNALAQIAGQGIGESIASTGQATGAYSAGSNTLANLGNQQIAQQQIQAEQKGNVLGALGSLAGSGAEIATAGTDSIIGQTLGF